MAGQDKQAAAVGSDWILFVGAVLVPILVVAIKALAISGGVPRPW